MRRFWLGVAGLLVVGAAVAATTGVGIPTNFITSPIGTEQVCVTASSPQIWCIALSQARDASGYAKLIPVTGATYATPNNISVIQATPAGGLSAWTVTTPTGPYDGQRLRIFTTQTVTTFNLTAATGQTVNGNLAGTLTANTAVEYLYSLSTTTWDRTL